MCFGWFRKLIGKSSKLGTFQFNGKNYFLKDYPVSELSINGNAANYGFIFNFKHKTVMFVASRKKKGPAKKAALSSKILGKSSLTKDFTANLPFKAFEEEVMVNAQNLGPRSVNFFAVDHFILNPGKKKKVSNSENPYAAPED